MSENPAGQVVTIPPAYRQFIIGFLRRQKESMKKVEDKCNAIAAKHQELEDKLRDAIERLDYIEAVESDDAAAQSAGEEENDTVYEYQGAYDKCVNTTHSATRNCTVCKYMGRIEYGRGTCYLRHNQDGGNMFVSLPRYAVCKSFETMDDIQCSTRGLFSRRVELGPAVANSTEETAAPIPCFSLISGFDFSDKQNTGGNE